MRRSSLGGFLKGIPFGVQLLLVLSVALLVFALVNWSGSAWSSSGEATAAPLQTATATATLPPTSTQMATEPATSLPSPTPQVTSALPVPEGGMVYSIEPDVNRVGWVVSGEEGNHFGEAHLYAGILEGKVYHGAFQFDVSFIPPGSVVRYAALELTGLAQEQVDGQGEWSVQMLGMEADPEWPMHGFSQIHDASIAHTLSPFLDSSDLAQGKLYSFEFNVDQRAELESRVARGVVSFRLDGPSEGSDNLFSWDSGYGEGSLNKGPVLRLAVRPASVRITPTAEDRIAGLGTPTPKYVVITSEPTPENILTAAVDAQTATAWATRVGTPTSVPRSWVTPIIVTATSTPANQATAAVRARVATAQVYLTGTPTPTPGNVWTATPTSTYVIVTLPPSPENTETAVAEALTATAQAATTGTPTPLPANWVTPIVLTATPTPENEATSTAQVMVATAQALLTGTVTPTAENVWVVTSTPTPMYVYLWDLPPAEVPATSTPTALPFTLQGKIAFYSNRRDTPAIYIMNPDGGRIALLTDNWPYEFALPYQEVAADDEGYVSLDGRYIVYHVGQPGRRQIYIRNIDGSNPRNISNNEFDEYNPVWLSGRRPTLTMTPTMAPTPAPTPTRPPPPPRPTSTPRPKPTPGV